MRASIAVLAIAAGLSGCGILGTSSDPGREARPTVDPKPPVVGTTIQDPIGGGPIKEPLDFRGAGIDLKRSVYYEFDKYDVKPEYRALVESHALWLRQNPAARIVVVGNTDER